MSIVLLNLFLISFFFLAVTQKVLANDIEIVNHSENNINKHDSLLRGAIINKLSNKWSNPSCDPSSFMDCPNGSYLKSCKECKYYKVSPGTPVLECLCKQPNGSYESTKLEGTCDADIDNRFGGLRCMIEHKWSHPNCDKYSPSECPKGDYLKSCSDCAFGIGEDSDFLLVCLCRDESNRNTKTTLKGWCNGKIENRDGELICMIEHKWSHRNCDKYSPNDCPSGDYLESCYGCEYRINKHNTPILECYCPSSYALFGITRPRLEGICLDRIENIYGKLMCLKDREWTNPSCRSISPYDCPAGTYTDSCKDCVYDKNYYGDNHPILVCLCKNKDKKYKETNFAGFCNKDIINMGGELGCDIPTKWSHWNCDNNSPYDCPKGSYLDSCKKCKYYPSTYDDHTEKYTSLITCDCGNTYLSKFRGPCDKDIKNQNGYLVCKD